MRNLRKRLGMVGIAFLALVALSGVVDVGVARAQGGAEHQFSITGDDGSVIPSGRCRFLTAGANTNLTLYTTRSLATTKTNPVTIDTTTGVCKAFLPLGTDTIDVIVYVDGGSFKGSDRRADAVSRTSRKNIVVSHSALKHLAVPFSATASTSTTTTTYTLPPGARAQAAIIETTTAVAASGINVNLAGTQGGLCSDASTAVVGFAACNLDGSSGNVLTANAAVTLHNQNHPSEGLAHIWYVLAANEP